jgi:hypothetical protein
MKKTLTADRAWIRQLLEARGYKARDLAKTWGTSEAAISRFINALDSGDISFSRAYSLSRMLGLDLEQLAQRMGHAGGAVIVPPAPPSFEAPPLPTCQIQPHEGRVRVLIHMDLSPEAAGDLLKVMTTASSPPPFSSNREDFLLAPIARSCV